MEARSEARARRRLIGVAIGARTQAEAQLALRRVARSADVAEIRLDLMEEYDLPRLLRDRPCPVIVTNRPVREGGRFSGSETERVRVLREAIGLGAEYVDVEHDSLHLVPERGGSQLVVSRHDFAGMPENLLEIHRDLASRGADVVKVVGMAQRLQDSIAPLDVLAQAGRPTIAIAMGEHGLLSRILALRYDSCLLTYAVLSGAERTAPGQLTLDTLRNVFHAQHIGARTVAYGVLSAQPVSERLLTALNAAARGAGLDAVWLPVVDPLVTPEAFQHIARALRRHGVSGYIVSESARGAVARVSDEAVVAGPRGEVNALRWVGERLVGAWTVDTAEGFAFVTGRRAALTV